ncbi:DHA2 family efflux MFS transporter permease subunit [Alicyclobacillus sp. SO9]|uniref:DHA2 family efflux MFS transporter permease subunit n=1 Tax=Alicyclobacillus sp. SO9 TaxID=2665646 RepID=UPI0018E83EE0|nr:DHA2 family efflux MFS transporter permease subunit [Alicyclobacillus sp. SO9]QQE77421.1 DHA2 family efflux MFS transporter permease subunit [Alicyclobacillus sp. SO9]
MKEKKSQKWWALGAIALAVMAIGLDMTVLNLALPTLSTALHASSTQLLWFVDAYALVLAAAMLPAGMLGDRIGRKKLLLIALAVFGLGSLACAYSPSATVFILSRILLGLGAAALFPLALSIIPVSFSDSERPKAVAVLMVATLISFPVGPILGGWMLTHYWWGTVFLMNVPIVILAIIAVAFLLTESRSSERGPIDWLGIITSSVGLTALTYGVIESGPHGFNSSAAMIPIIVGVLVLVACVWWERKARNPLIDLSLFSSRAFLWGTVLTTLVSFVMFGVLFATPQYFQDVLGLTAFESGLRLLPLIAGLLVGAIAATRLAAFAGAKWAVGLGFVLLAAGVLIGGRTTIHSEAGFSVWWLSISGLGLGFAMPTAMDAALGALSGERSGVGSALIQAVRQAGGTIGVAVLGSVLAGGYRHHLNVHGLPSSIASLAQKNVSAGIETAHKLGLPGLLESVRASFVHGMNEALWVSGSIAILDVILALTFLPGRVHSEKKGDVSE